MPKLSPVEDYLKLQGRFQHLFEPMVQAEAIAHIQGGVNAYWEQVKKAEKTASQC
jgi:pyruvate ferredoxin oxidoreductase beta subunit